MYVAQHLNMSKMCFISSVVGIITTLYNKALFSQQHGGIPLVKSFVTLIAKHLPLQRVYDFSYTCSEF